MKSTDLENVGASKNVWQPCGPPQSVTRIYIKWNKNCKMGSKILETFCSVSIQSRNSATWWNQASDLYSGVASSNLNLDTGSPPAPPGECMNKIGTPDYLHILHNSSFIDHPSAESVTLKPNTRWWPKKKNEKYIERKDILNKLSHLHCLLYFLF
jgi:hypothetical protein